MIKANGERHANTAALWWDAHRSAGRRWRWGEDGVRRSVHDAQQTLFLSLGASLNVAVSRRSGGDTRSQHRTGPGQNSDRGWQVSRCELVGGKTGRGGHTEQRLGR